MKVRNDGSFPPGDASSSSSCARSSPKAAPDPSAKKQTKKKKQNNAVVVVPNRTCSWSIVCSPSTLTVWSISAFRTAATGMEALETTTCRICYGGLVPFAWRWFAWMWIRWLRCIVFLTVRGRRLQIFPQICVNVQKNSWHKLINTTSLKCLHQSTKCL